MASSEPPRFDDSEDEEDFNPAPADLSDDEPAHNDTSPPSKSNSRRRDYAEADDGDDNDEIGNKVTGKTRPAPDEDDDQSDGDGEQDRVQDEEDEEEEDEEDDEDEDIQQVSA